MHNWPLAFHESTSNDTQSVGSVTGAVILGMMNSSSLSHTRQCMAIGHFLGTWMTGFGIIPKAMW